MAASVATIGYGGTLEWSTDGFSADTNEVAELKSCEVPSNSVEKVERTHMGSPNRSKEYTLGLRDPQDLSFVFNFNSTDYAALAALEAAGTIVDWRHTLAPEDGTTTGAQYTYKGGVVLGSAETTVEGVTEVTATILRTSAATFAAAS